MIKIELTESNANFLEELLRRELYDIGQMKNLYEYALCSSSPSYNFYELKEASLCDILDQLKKEGE